jgi:hypothetical protein
MAIHDIHEIRILPAFAIARLGSSPEPMDNYDWSVPDPVGYRRLVPAETFYIDSNTGKILSRKKPDEVRFRDSKNRIRPISPFLEAWACFKRNGPLVPLTQKHLNELDLRASAIKWRVQLGNNKAFRRTKDPRDKILADTGFYSDFTKRPLLGRCDNFLKGKKIPFGFGQYIKPTPNFPEIRFRFTPAGGFVYGPPPTKDQEKSSTFRAVLKDIVYDTHLGHWKGYQDLDTDPTTTAPASIFANAGSDPVRSLGYLDDECDGILELELQLKTKKLKAFARIIAGPPTFAPDGAPVRTVGDELEQALLGTLLNGKVNRADIENILRRAMETVRLMNSSLMNHSVGMAWADSSQYGRASQPIMDPNVVDNLAIVSRHEQVLLALESGSLAWFSRLLRHYNEVGDLTDEGRRKMPALMRGADGSHLALTRRMVQKIQEAADLFQQHKHIVPGKKPKNNQ